MSQRRKETVQLGQEIGGDPILATYEETETGYTLSGQKPFGGKPRKFIPVPQGYEGVRPIKVAATLSQIVEIQERAIYAMGNPPISYYDYRNNVCFEYYDIKKIAPEFELTDEEYRENKLRQLLHNTVDVMTHDMLRSLVKTLDLGSEFIEVNDE